MQGLDRKTAPRGSGKAAMSALIGGMIVLVGVWASFIVWACLTFPPEALVNVAAAAMLLLGVLVISTVLDLR